MEIIDHFRRRGAMVVATTHYDALKSYASTTEGVMAAGFGFDPQTFAPTYRLNYGSPGSSLALEIANRLGLPAAVIEQARAHRTARESQLAEHLSKVERDMQALEHDTGWPRGSETLTKRRPAPGLHSFAPGRDVPPPARGAHRIAPSDAPGRIDARRRSV